MSCVTTGEVAALAYALSGSCAVRERRVDLWTIVHAAYATGGDDFAALVALSPSLDDCLDAAREYGAVLDGVTAAMRATRLGTDGVTPQDVVTAVLWRGREFCAEFLHNPFMLYAADVRLYPGRGGFVGRALAEFSWACFRVDVMAPYS